MTFNRILLIQYAIITLKLVDYYYIERRKIMKNTKIKKNLALFVCTIAMSVAAVSTSMCAFWFFNEPKMPKSLYKLD